MIITIRNVLYFNIRVCMVKKAIGWAAPPTGQLIYLQLSLWSPIQGSNQALLSFYICHWILPMCSQDNLNRYLLDYLLDFCKKYSSSAIQDSCLHFHDSFCINLVCVFAAMCNTLLDSSISCPCGRRCDFRPNGMV